MSRWITKNWMWVAMLGTAAVYAPLAGRSGEDGAKLKNLETLTEVLGLVQKESPEPPAPKQMTHATIQGMLHTLDPHSNYMDESEYRMLREEQKGSFFGIGAIISQQEQGIAIVSPIKGGPSERLGVRAGDIIREIDGVSAEGMSTTAALEKLRGEKGTVVEIKVQRAGFPDLLPFSIARAEIPSNSVYYSFMLNPSTGYILIKDFGETTAEEFERAVGDLKRQGMRSLVLDLRANGGGLLDAAIGVCRQLLGPDQLIVTTKGRDGKDETPTFTPKGAMLDPFPLIILTNRGTASASEIVSGAVQDHDRGLVVGTVTWGKGLVQSVLTIGRTRGLALTTARYYTPSGRLIQRDYTHGLDDYYNPDDEQASKPSGPEYKTDLGRTVFGGGGITPDVVVAPAKGNPFLVELRYRHSAFFRYAVVEKEKFGVKEGEHADDALLARFKAWLQENKVPFDEAKWAENAEAMKDILNVEMQNVAFGVQAGQKATAEKDPVIQRALELLPEAEKLLQKKELDLRAKGHVVTTASAGRPAELWVA